MSTARLLPDLQAILTALSTVVKAKSGGFAAV